MVNIGNRQWFSKCSGIPGENINLRESTQPTWGKTHNSEPVHSRSSSDSRYLLVSTVALCAVFRDAVSLAPLIDRETEQVAGVKYLKLGKKP